MKSRSGLRLYEEIMLLALRDEKGTIASGVWIDYAIAGAILAELMLEERVGVDDEGKRKKFARALSPRRTGDPLLDECLAKLRGAKRRATLTTWVSRFASVKKLRQRVADRLCRKGILRSDEDKVMMLFTRKIYPELDPVPEREIVARMRQAIFTRKRDIDPRTSILVSLASGSSILRVVFDKKKLKQQKDRIEEIQNGDLTRGATKAAVEAVQAAVLVAVIMPAVYSAAT